MMPTASTAPRAERGAIPSLDGIRAIAVALVFLAHSGLDRVVPGGLGVTVFFVLSGYLITTLTRVEHARTGAIDFRAFYLRRLLRLMPPLVIVVALAGVLSALGVIGGGFTAGGLLAALLYAGNYHVIANHFAGLPAGLGVVWSLAIEEHYYLVYPPLAALLLRVARVRWSVVLLVALCAAVLAWRCWLALHGASVDHLTMATDTRIDAILVGCVMGLWHNPWLDAAPDDAPRRGATRAAAQAAFGLGLLLFSLAWRDEVFRVTARFTLQSVAIALLIHLAVTQAGRWPYRWLNTRPLVYLGTISYTVYLSHQLILLGLERHLPSWSWLGLTVAGAALTWAVAEPMRRWVERPCAELRRRLHRDRPARTAEPGRLAAGTP